MTGPHTPPARQSRWPWVVAALAIGLLAVALFIEPPSDDTGGDLLGSVVFGAAVLALSVVGAVLVVRVPANRIGYLLLGAGLLMSIAVGLGVYVEIGVIAPGGPWPGVALAALLNQVLFIYPIVITLVLVPLVFPDGRLPGRRWRSVVAITVSALAALAVSTLFRPAMLIGEIENPFAAPSLAPLVGVLEAYASVTAFVAFGGALASIAVRYRRGDPVERQQLKWLLATAGLAAVSFPISQLVPDQGLADALFLLTLVAFIGLPVAIGIAVLRYRLYEIDRLVSRTIGWAIVSGVLVGAFILLVVGLQAALAPLTRDNTLAVAGSTLVVAALFAPLRARVQRFVDRRFDRGRYDGERLLESFGEHLRSEVDAAVIRREVLVTVEAAVRPMGAGLWLRPGPGSR